MTTSYYFHTLPAQSYTISQMVIKRTIIWWCLLYKK